MLKIKESNVTIMVKNLDKSIMFYEHLGLKLKNRRGNHYAQMMTKDIIIGLHPTVEDLPDSSKISIGFSVDSIEEAKELLNENNIDFHFEEGKSGYYLHFKDKDGTKIYFVQPKWG